MIISTFAKLSRSIMRFCNRRLLVDHCGAPKNIQTLGRVNLFNRDICFGEYNVLYPGVTFSGEGKIKLGNKVKIGQNTIIHASLGSYVEIGDNTIIAANVYVIDSNHRFHLGMPIQEQGFSSQPVVIGSDVWVGANAVISKGSVIGDGCVIGALSYVSGRVEPNSILTTRLMPQVKKRK